MVHHVLHTRNESRFLKLNLFLNKKNALNSVNLLFELYCQQMEPYNLLLTTSQDTFALPIVQLGFYIFYLFSCFLPFPYLPKGTEGGKMWMWLTNWLPLWVLEIIMHLKVDTSWESDLNNSAICKSKVAKSFNHTLYIKSNTIDSSSGTPKMCFFPTFGYFMYLSPKLWGNGCYWKRMTDQNEI